MYAQSDIYIMPSVSEPFGISPLEAMRYDVPVIVSKQSGVAEILDNALKVDFWDIDEIANKILAILNHEPLRQEIVARSSQDIQRFQWDSAAQNVVNLYQQVIA
jgi:glycosyltransferase involved in cell wall biosynthesis